MRELLRGSRSCARARFLPVRAPVSVLAALIAASARRPGAVPVRLARRASPATSRSSRDEIGRKRPDVELIGGPQAAASRPAVRFGDLLRLPFLMATSPVIVLDDFYPARLRRSGSAAAHVSCRSGTRRARSSGSVTAGAGSPAVRRRAARSTATTPTPTSARRRIRDDYADAFGIDLGRVRALGVPRTRLLLRRRRAWRRPGRACARRGIGDDERLVVFAPTFRGDGQLQRATRTTRRTGPRSLVELGDGWRVAVRRHPFTRRECAPLPARTSSTCRRPSR